jgi:valyl-tRNA synthetase
MKKELAKSYEPKQVEKKWYPFWESKGFFNADATSSKPPYTIAIPPPNVTGVLHMGHALVDTLQDILIRWKRMSGFEALWVPGTDHAGIATQTVVERHLMKTTGKRRKDFEREEFLNHVWEWKEKSEATILSQLKSLGCSCDWSRLCFTMDAQRNFAVKTVFKKMFDQGLIYRGDYLVNWDPVTQTALADDEVEYEEKNSSLWYFRYPLEDSKEHLIIATTRPETMLGDTALAVSPKDERYKHLIGKHALLPIINRRLPIIADNYVDPKFGTGVVKITPAHDPNDYEIGLNHNLDMINIMTPDGKINENGAQFQGLSMEEARCSVVQEMHSLGLVEKIDPYPLRIGVSYRSKAIIEPYLSKQWFVKLSAFKQQMRKAVEEGNVKMIPSSWQQTYYHWIDNLRDWCISRQLWWGHRIPIWYNKDNPDQMICYAGDDLPEEVKKQPQQWQQDEDVLDTWFSSALWPFSILGWPHDTPDFKKFFPTSTLITGHDILFFWVARMIFMSEYILNTVPFSETFLHGLIYGKSYWRIDEQGHIAYVPDQERLDYDLGQPVPKEVHSKWEKMSKSKGNIIDPLEIIDSYGADAMRMALAASATHARQIDLDRRRFEEFKNFTNKVWNGTRFVLMNLESLTTDQLGNGLNLSLLKLEDKWILFALNRVIAEVNANLDTYAFDRAAMLAYDFFWKEFCAYYVEITKPVLFGKAGTLEEKENKQKILLIVLCSALRLMHPMAPFITEELFQILKEQFDGVVPQNHADAYTQELSQALKAPACITAPYPTADNKETIDSCVEKDFAFIDELIRVIRNIRAEMSLLPNLPNDLIIVAPEENRELLLTKENQPILTSLIRLGSITYQEKEPTLAFSASSYAGPLKIIIPLPQEMKDKERLRLSKEQEKLIARQNGAREKLSNPSFVEKAPPHLVDKVKVELEETEKQLLDLTKKLQQLT